MKERLERSIRAINKSALLEHAKELKSQEMTMSSPFSAGQYWICFEMVAKDGSLVIARVRLPRHPDMPDTVNEDDEAYSIACEVTTMSFVKEALPDIKIPHLYAYEDKESPRAKDASAPYMLIEGFRGNSLMDTEFDMTVLPVSEDPDLKQNHSLGLLISVRLLLKNASLTSGLISKSSWRLRLLARLVQFHLRKWQQTPSLGG